jgi:hypothetical protein
MPFRLGVLPTRPVQYRAPCFWTLVAHPEVDQNAEADVAANGLVFPSDDGETWSLIVNEAIPRAVAGAVSALSLPGAGRGTEERARAC